MDVIPYKVDRFYSALDQYVNRWQILNPEELPYETLRRSSAWTTVLIRFLCFIFLRWIPTPLIPKFVGALLAVYLPSFITQCLSKPHYDTTGEKSEILITPAETEDTNGAPADDSGAVTVEATRTRIMSRTKTPAWKTLGLGIPSLKDNPILTALTLLINLMLVIWTYDHTWTSSTFHKSSELSFARVGWVSDTSARILVREPKDSEFVINPSVYVVSHREAEDEDNQSLAKRFIPKWVNTKTVGPFNNYSDYTSFVELTGLSPNTKYQYLTTGQHRGTFTTAPRYGEKGKFTFLTSSCIKQRVPYNPFHHPLHIPGFKTLSKMLPELKASFMLFLGDFIYIDVPRRPGTDKESYRMMYRQIYNSPDWPGVSKNLPWIHVLDDHEIQNDWSAGETGIYQSAIDPFNAYLHHVNPPPVRTNVSYYSFSWGPASFFMLDTRRYRSPSNMEDGPGKSMLGDEQLSELLSWLRRSDRHTQWKIVVSSVPFTKNWLHDGFDTWRGYLHERAKILDVMWGVKGAGVVVLSGDRHEFGATRFVPPVGSIHSENAAVHEFSVSPLSQFYLPIRTYKQVDDEDRMIKYIPDGNQKFGSIEIDSTNAEQALLKFKLFVDGKERWNWVLTAPTS